MIGQLKLSATLSAVVSIIISKALQLLENKTHDSKTAIIEKALELYVKKEMASQNVLLPYAGVLTKKDADSMLDIIETSKHNKDIDINL